MVIRAWDAKFEPNLRNINPHRFASGIQKISQSSGNHVIRSYSIHTVFATYTQIFSCNLTDYGSSFQSRFNYKSNETCLPTEELIGCTGYVSYGKYNGDTTFDGIFTGNTQMNPGDSSKVFNTFNRCTANNGIHIYIL